MGFKTWSKFTGRNLRTHGQAHHQGEGQDHVKTTPTLNARPVLDHFAQPARKHIHNKVFGICPEKVASVGLKD